MLRVKLFYNKTKNKNKKKEYLKLSKKDRMYQLGENIQVERYIFYKLPKFNQLGVLLTQNNELKAEIARKIQLANKCYFGAGTLLKSSSISINLKIKMYMTFIRAIIIYGLEIKALSTTEEVKIVIFERKVLRRILYGLYLDPQTGEWRIR